MEKPKVSTDTTEGHVNIICTFQFIMDRTDRSKSCNFETVPDLHCLFSTLKRGPDRIAR